jgi:hypothetical protein
LQESWNNSDNSTWSNVDGRTSKTIYPLSVVRGTNEGRIPETPELHFHVIYMPHRRTTEKIKGNRVRILSGKILAGEKLKESMMKVRFQLIKANGHVAYGGCLEEECLPTFLRGSGATKITYEKDGVEHTIINKNAVI